MLPEIWSTTERIFGRFLSFSTNNLKNQNYEKMKETPGDIIILRLVTINDNHMMHDS